MTVKQLLLKYRQSAELIDGEKYLSVFIDEMKRGLEGKGECSLAMLPSYLYEARPSKENAGKKVIVIDAGGTNFRSAAGYFTDGGEAVFENEHRTVMPAVGETLSKEEFYDAIASNISRLLGEGTDIGFCFSYPVKMEEGGDGVLTSFTKAVDAPEAVGTRVGECTLRAVRKYDGKTRRIVILNDTVAALLGGLASVRDEYSAYIGYIYGTGTNICYAEKTENIKKAQGLPPDRKMLINTECGNFDKFPRGDIDTEVANSTENSERQLFEKMASGKYLASVIRLTFEKAVKEGVMTRAVEKEFTLKDVSDFLAGEENIIYSSLVTQADRNSAAEICRAYIERAALLGAIANAAAAVMSGTPNGKPVAVFAEGTTFEKLYGYKELFKGRLAGLLEPRGIAFEIIRCEETNFKGCLTAALTI